MTKETFEKADELIRMINGYKRALDAAYQYKNRASRLDIYAIFPEDEKEKRYIVEGELMHQILDLIHSAEEEKLAKLEDEFKAL